MEFFLMFLFLMVVVMLVFPGWAIRSNARDRATRERQPLKKMRPGHPFVCCEHDSDCERRGEPCSNWRGPMVVDAPAIWKRWNRRS